MGQEDEKGANPFPKGGSTMDIVLRGTTKKSADSRSR